MASEGPESLLEEAKELNERDEWKEAKKKLQTFFKKVPKDKASTEILVKANLLMANILSNMTEFKVALDHCNEALSLSASINDEPSMAEATRLLGFIKWRRSDFNGAMKDMIKALDMAKRLKDLRLQGVMHIEMAMCHSARGDLDKSERALREAILILSKAGDNKQLSRAYNNLGDGLLNQGKFEKAVEFFEKAKKLGNKIGAADMSAFAGFNIAECMFELGKYDEALAELDESLPVLEKIGDLYGEAGANQVYGLVYGKLGDWQRAEEHLFKARRQAKKSNMPVSEAMIIRDIGRVYLWRGDKDKARLYLKEAKEIFERHDAQKDLSKVLKDIKELEEE
jgi:tetratricopeptide (TPR) repeat protein